MNGFQFRIALTRTHAGFLVFLPHFFDLTEALRTTGRVGMLPTHSIQRLRATGAGHPARPPRWRKVNQAYPIQAGQIDINLHETTSISPGWVRTFHAAFTRHRAGGPVSRPYKVVLVESTKYAR